MKKRIISFLLVLCLLAGMVPMMVPQADAIIGSVLKYGLKTCVAVVKGTITTCQNIDHYNGNVGKAVLGQFKNIGAELTGLDIGEDYGDATVIIGLKQNPTYGRRFSPIFLFIRAFCGAKRKMLL